LTTLIFDCDGTLADTERYGHLPAFNQTFREFGLPVEWSEEEYGRRLVIGGGKERLASLLTPAFVRAMGLPDDREALRLQVARWHRRKTEIYVEMVEEGRLPARPGIRRVIAAALDAGWTLAVASTSADASVRAILESVAGSDGSARFALVLAGDVVAHKKPAPDIYHLALARLGVAAADVVVVEDSRNGLLAADGAALACLVTVNGYTQHENMEEARMVVTSLGDPGTERTTVLRNRTAAHPGDYLTLGDLEAARIPAPG
jgi:HAD superfamily hydrolase (TIGR01509 family)